MSYNLQLLLLLLILVPLIGILLILPFKLSSNLNVSRVKCIALIASLINFFLSALLLLNYDFNASGYQFIIAPLPSLYDISSLIPYDGLAKVFSPLFANNFDLLNLTVSPIIDDGTPTRLLDISYEKVPMPDRLDTNTLPLPYGPGVDASLTLPLGYSNSQGEFLGAVGGGLVAIGVDEKSLFFILLTTFVTPICILSNWSDIQEIGKLKYYLALFLLLETLQIAVFSVLDLFWFYIFFESVLIPLFLLIIIWGSSSKKYRAGFLLFLYTLFGSLFMLISILWIKNNLGSTDFRLISLSIKNIDSPISIYLWLGFFIAFAIKTPIWPFNTWLINAHVEAPLGGSIILAATILKLATYGFLRVLIGFFPEATSYFLPLVLGLSILSLIYASLSTIRQIDTKAVIAYSSVAHMAVGLLGLFSMTTLGYEGAIYLSLAHGFVSPGLFICCGGIIYVRLHTRIIPYIKGLAFYMPIFTILFFMFTLCNAGIPLSLNFIGEILSLIASWQHNPILAILGSTGIVLSACYSIFLYNRLSYGSISNYHAPLKDIDKREFNLLITLLSITLILGIIPPMLNFFYFL